MLKTHPSIRISQFWGISLPIHQHRPYKTTHPSTLSTHDEKHTAHLRPYSIIDLIMIAIVAILVNYSFVISFHNCIRNHSINLFASAPSSQRARGIILMADIHFIFILFLLRRSGF